MQYLENYAWPGNIRELENIIERQVILAKNDKLNFEFLAEEINLNNPPANQQIKPNLISAQQHKQLEKTNLENALKHCKGKMEHLLSWIPSTVKCEAYKQTHHVASCALCIKGGTTLVYN